MPETEIIVPGWWRVMHYTKEYDNPSIMGFDSETVNGMPYTLQFWQPNLHKLLFVNADNVLRKFLEFIEALPDKRLILFCYYAKFDLPVLLYPYLHMFAEDTIEIKIQGWEIKIFCAKNYWASLYHAKTGKYVQIVDIYNFFKGGLEKVGDSLGVKVRKMRKPDKLGEYAFGKNNTYYVRYAMRDAQIAYEIGKMIALEHQQFDIPVCMSAPKMAEIVFRKHFLEEGEEYILPKNEKCLAYSLHAYHGAKNGYYLDGPAFFHEIYDYDIISAYPYAMSILPSFLKGRYVAVQRFVEDVLNYPGVYFVVGRLKPCRYGCLATPGFRYINEGGAIKTFTTGYELKEALRSGELQLDFCNGFVFESKELRNPLLNYVDYFFQEKRKSAKKSVRYEFYKLLLNSLYGKWIQTNPLVKEKIVVGEDLDMRLVPSRKVAAGLFNPFIAASITGFIRAELHRLEHRYHAVETSTDSFKTVQPIQITRAMQRLGGLEEKFHGSALFCRNRLNLLLKRGKIKGYALHGFWGTAEDLYNLYLSRSNTYPVTRMPLVRESLIHRGKTPFRMQEDVRTLNVKWNQLQVVKKGASYGNGV